MTLPYIAVVNTRSPSCTLVHDAAQPYAVVEFSRSGVTVIRTISRHESYRGACIKAGKVIAAARRVAA